MESVNDKLTVNEILPVFRGKFTATVASDSHQCEHEVSEIILDENEGRISGEFATGFGHQMDAWEELRWWRTPISGEITEPGSGVRTAIVRGNFNCHRFENEFLRFRLVVRKDVLGKDRLELDLLPTDEDSILITYRQV